jgi:uncharacterized protein (DUF2147 family)
VIRRIAAAVLVALLASGTAQAADPTAVMGDWWTQDRDGIVRIYACPAGLCGLVSGVTNFAPDGTPPKDLHGRSRCHLQIIPDGKVDDEGVWDGHIINPDDDKRYTITLRVDEDGRLRMRGYIGIPLLGKTVFWTRFNGHLTPDCHVRN